MARLLIVDDERNIRRSPVTFFESRGHLVRAAESGTQAIASLAETNVTALWRKRRRYGSSNPIVE